MRLTLKFADGTVEEIRPAPVDLVRFERHYKLAAAKVEDDPRTEYVMFLAWSALTRTGRTSDEFDTWLETLADIDDDDSEVRQTDPLPPPPG